MKERRQKVPRKKTMERDYTTVSVPVTLKELIEKAIETQKLPYRNWVDFILEATRRRLQELGALR